MYPQLKGSLPENLKHLKDSMDGLDWKVSTGTLPPCLKQPWDEGREQGSRRKLEAASQHLSSHRGRMLELEEPP